MRYLLYTLIIISLLLATVSTRRKTDVLKGQSQTKEQRTTVVEANHFFSQKQTSKTFDIPSLQKNKPLVFLLLDTDQTSTTQQLYNNPVSVSLTAGASSKQCNFTLGHSLCALPNIIIQKATLKIQCKKTPCSVRWKIVQPQTIEIDGKHSLNHLVSVNEEKNHAILKLYCTNPEIRLTLDSKIEIYTNSAFNKVVNKQGEVSFLFNNQQKGEYFITTKDKAIEQCTNAILQHTTEQLELRKDGFAISDFLSYANQDIYQILKMPDTDVRLEVTAYDAEMKQLSNDTSLTISLVGIKQNKPTKLRGQTLAIDDEKDFIDFSMVFKKPTEKYDKLQLHLKGTNKNFLILHMSFVADDVHQVQMTEQSYFDLKKGEKINYKMVPVAKQITNIDTVNIFLSDHKQFNITKESCPKEGCQFIVQALEDAHGFIYVGKDITNKKSTEIIEQEFDKSVGSKLREGQQKYYSYKLKANDAIQMLVNTPNVIVYTANKQVCEAKKLTQCHERQVSYHNPSIYESKKDITLVFKVVALDYSEFVLTIIDAKSPYIEIKDTQPFVYLMDGSQHQIFLHFKMYEKEDVSFNLIAPLNQLNLIVYNKDKIDKENSNSQSDEAQFSSEGFVSYIKSSLKSTFFVIKIEKRQEYKDKFVHFTMIASTKQANLRLETGTPHYQTLKPKVTRDLVFQFIPKYKIFLNFYTHNINKDINVSLKVSNADEYTNASNMAHFTIDKPTDVLDISQVSETLCRSLESECQLFVRLQNLMSVEIDITITLLMENSVIELKDGIWQNYDVNKAASSTHFYFLPKHNKHSIAIFYHSSLVDLKIVYRLWKSEDTSVDMSEWPFPMQFNETANKPSPLQFKPTEFIHIEPKQLQQCWPNCVVLLSIISDTKQLQKQQKDQTPVFIQSHQFKIMASNNLVQIPQKHKLDFVLNNGQQKTLLVDLKYFLEKQSLIFFTYLTMGSVSFKVNVYSERNPRCPTSEELTADFTFLGIETQIEMEEVKKKLQQNSMENDKSPYLCILAHAFTESKIAIEFTSEATDIKNLQADTNTPVKLKPSETRMFQINAYFDFYLKVSRTSGFPYLSKKLCNPNKDKDMQACLDDFKNNDEKGEQMANKIVALSQPPCNSCMFYLKVTAKQEAEITIHAQSKYVEIQLKENTPLTDILSPNQLNKYQITGATGKQAIINIQILSGDINVSVMDFQFVSINKKNQKGSTNINFVIPTKDLTDKRRNNPTFATSFGLSNFNNYHVTIQSQDQKLPASYIITYSNGQANIYLQDGLLSQYNVAPKKTSKFYYNNPSFTGIYLYLSTSQAQALNSLKLKVYATEQRDDQESKTQIKAQKSQFSKKTVNPTLLLHLPYHSQYIVQIENSNSKDVLFFIGINDKEIIYLPFDHEFPFRLQMKSYLYFVLPTTSAAGYVRFTLNKCNSNQPFVAYTDEYSEFVDEIFDTEEQITDTLIYQNVIKVKAGKALYFKVRAQELAESIVTVKASFSISKIEINRAKAGNKGNIQYQLLQARKAEIAYSGVVCQKNCGQFTYSAISSTHFESIIAQLVCPSVSFDLLGFTQTNHPQTIPIKPIKTSDNKLSFNLTMSSDNQFIGIKAINSKSGASVYYQPIQIANFAGKINNAIAVASSPKHLPWVFAIFSLCLICFPLIAYRRYKKKREYSALNNDEMQDTMN